MPKSLKPMTVIGFDFGLKSIGIAVGQTITKTAKPLTTINARQGVPNWQQLTPIINKWQPDLLLIGEPLNMDATASERSLLANEFAQSLRDHYHIPITMVDERLSTQAARMQSAAEAGNFWDKKHIIDGIAAQIIVEQWLQKRET